MQTHLIISKTIMALSRNNASHEVDAAPRVVDGNDRDHNDRLFVWLDAQMALSLNFMDPQESQGSNNVPPDVTPEASIINHLESHGSNDMGATLIIIWYSCTQQSSFSFFFNSQKL